MPQADSRTVHATGGALEHAEYAVFARIGCDAHNGLRCDCGSRSIPYGLKPRRASAAPDKRSGRFSHPAFWLKTVTIVISAFLHSLKIRELQTIPASCCAETVGLFPYCHKRYKSHWNNMPANKFHLESVRTLYAEDVYIAIVVAF